MISALQKPNDKARQLVSSFWRASRPARLRNLTEWAEAELRIPSGPAAGLKYKVDRQPYAKLLLPQLGKWRRHVITGPTQSGKSLHAFAMLIIYYLFEVKEDVIVGLPDLGMAGAKWEKDIKPFILRSRYSGLLPKRGSGSQGGKPVLITFLNGRTLQFMGGGGADSQRAASTARVLVITETDALDEVSQTSKEGQNKVDQLEGRVRAHGLESITSMECTVTNTSGRTWREYLAGTQSKIVCPCPYCSEYVGPEREHFVGWDSATDEIEASEKAAFSCPACGHLLDENDRKAMNHAAVLLHRGQTINAAGEISGDPPKTQTFSFRWSAFNNLFTPIALLGIEEWKAARAENAVEAEVRLKQQVWCLPTDDKTVEKVPLSIGIVRGSAEGFHGRLNGRQEWTLPDWSKWVTLYVDVGMRVLNWSVNAHGPRGLRDVIAYGATATEQPDVIGPEEAILSGLHRVRELIESHCDLTLALVDCRYQGNKKAKDPRRVVYEFIMSCGSPWFAAMGLSDWSQKQKSPTVDPSLTGAPWYFSKQEYCGEHLWVCDFAPDPFKHLSHGSWSIRPSDEKSTRYNGSVTIFGADAKLHTEFAAQMNNERFEVDHTTGKSAWKRHGHNHYFDTDVGNLVARSVIESMEAAKRPADMAQNHAEPFTTPDGRAFFAGAR